MEDNEIIGLYLIRSERAIFETQNKYGHYCRYIANHILLDEEDAKECINDAYVGLWNAIPPQKPTSLKHFLGAILRNIAMNRLDYNNALKRSAETVPIIDELEECLPDTSSVFVDELMLKEIINGFLATLNKKSRIIFMRRYWYMCSVKEIAVGMGISESNVKVILHRTRDKFKSHLEKEGITL